MSLSSRLTALGPLPRPSARDQPAPWDALLAAGNAIILPVDESTMHAVAPDPEDGRVAAGSSEGNTIAVVPLVVAGSLSGALVLLAGGSARRSASRTCPLLQDVTARAGIAISQVRSTRQHRDIALRLQRALLPPAPPALTGFTIARAVRRRCAAGAGRWRLVGRPGRRRRPRRRRHR